MEKVTWVLEPEAFRGYYGLSGTVLSGGHDLVLWNDDWLGGSVNKCTTQKKTKN